MIRASIGNAVRAMQAPMNKVALNWLIAQGTVPIPGAKTAEQARHNAGGAGWSLSPTEVSDLSRLGGR